MLAAALTHLRDLLRAELESSTTPPPATGGWSVVVGPLADVPGGPPADGLVLTVTGVQQDVTLQAADPQRGPAGEPTWRLRVVLAARFGDQLEGLRALSAALAVLHRTPVLDAGTVPAFDARLARVQVDVENLPAPDMAALWGALGARSLPAVVCRVVVVPVSSGRTPVAGVRTIEMP